MREAVVILPDHEAANLHLELTLLAEFGGFTTTRGCGQWKDPTDGKVYEDGVAVYTIAMDPTDDNAQRLGVIAKAAGELANQICVYVRHPSGDVVFIDCDPK